MPKRVLVPAVILSNGFARCMFCDGVLLEDERHWHDKREVAEYVAKATVFISDRRPSEEHIKRGRELAK